MIPNNQKGINMDISKWKSVAVDVKSYLLLQALCKHGYRKPGAIIPKLVDQEVSKVAKKNNVSSSKMMDKLLEEVKTLKNGHDS